MPIADERRIVFDIGSFTDVVKFSRAAALSIGLPDNDPGNIALDPATNTATFAFAEAQVTIEKEKLAALLISYCIRSGIRIPRQGKRSVRVGPATIALVFMQNYATTPLPKAEAPDQARPRAMTWTT